MRVMITGGGTGGHTSPAVAIIEELRKRDPRLSVQWVGRKGAIEERVARNLGVPFRPVPAAGWPRERTIRRVWVAAKLALGIVRGMCYLHRFRPQVVIGVGGYVALPLCYAAQRMRIPTILHEQNKRLGMANRLLAPRATTLLLSYPDTLGDYPREKSHVVGNPVRLGFAHPPEREQARKTLGLDPAIPVVLISGGSQGAHSLNKAVMAALPQFNEGELQILWTTGNADAVAARQAAAQAKVRTEVFGFLDDMPTACAAADFVVCRSGASTIAEITMMGKPSILVPFPHATDNHQEQNALALKQAGAAIHIADKDLTGDLLVQTIRTLLADPAHLAAMARQARALAKPGAAESIVEQVLLLTFLDEVNGPNGREQEDRSNGTP